VFLGLWSVVALGYFLYFPCFMQFRFVILTYLFQAFGGMCALVVAHTGIS
jgi:hypothetical protein